MHLRPFIPADLEAVLHLFYTVVHTVGAKYYTAEQLEAWAPEVLDAKHWLRMLSERIAYVVEIEDQVVGFGDMTALGYIDHLYVDREHQGQGVARILFKKLEEDALRLGLSELTTEASIIAKPLAERQGFKVVREFRKVHRGIEFVGYAMSKKLSSV